MGRLKNSAININSFYFIAKQKQTKEMSTLNEEAATVHKQLK